jgi:hypothetical protein
MNTPSSLEQKDTSTRRTTSWSFRIGVVRLTIEWPKARRESLAASERTQYIEVHDYTWGDIVDEPTGRGDHEG